MNTFFLYEKKKLKLTQSCKKFVVDWTIWQLRLTNYRYRRWDKDSIKRNSE